MRFTAKSLVASALAHQSWRTRCRGCSQPCYISEIGLASRHQWASSGNAPSRALARPAWRCPAKTPGTPALSSLIALSVMATPPTLGDRWLLSRYCRSISKLAKKHQTTRRGRVVGIPPVTKLWRCTALSISGTSKSPVGRKPLEKARHVRFVPRAVAVALTTKRPPGTDRSATR